MACSRFRLKGTPLPFGVFGKIQTVTPGTVVENKRLGAALAMVKEHQATYAPNMRRYKGTGIICRPWFEKASSFQFSNNGLDRATPGMPVISKGEHS
jgi:hypothetical protein